jgi:hypothetical protein
VKRLFSSERLTVDRLSRISALLGFTMAELLQEAADSVIPLRTLTAAQEAQLVANDKLLLVAVCAFNHWSLDEIVAAYRLREAGVPQAPARARPHGRDRTAPGQPHPPCGSPATSTGSPTGRSGASSSARA